MLIGISWSAEYNAAFWLENGWSINITRLLCDHVALAVVPRWIHENRNEGIAAIDADQAHYSREAMIARGDLIEHFDGNDEALLDFIATVRARPLEPHFAKIKQDIMKAVKS